MRTALSIAGSDSCGGAGIQADLKTMTMNGVYAMTAVTALTAQNTTGVRAIQEATPEFLGQQIDAVFEDIFPDAVKIGMVSASELIRVIAKKLRDYEAKHIVVDPVMVATSGSVLLKTDAVETLEKELLPLAEVVTPNIPEAEILSGMAIKTKEDMLAAAEKISKTYGCAVLLKGGHSINDANDYLYANGEGHWFEGKRIDNPNTHGTGCTLSSAIASNLAKGYELPEAVKRAKDYISGALGAMLDLAVMGLLIGQCIGRWGNFMNREAFGAETTLPWRMQLTTVTGQLVEVHPTFLYESLWNLAGLLLIIFVVSKARRFDGENTWFYFLWYGIGRFWIEGLRTDSLYLFNWTIDGQPIRVSQALSLVMVFVSLFMLYYHIKLHPHKPEDLYVNIVAARNAAAAEAAIAPAAESPAQATPTEDAPAEAVSSETEAPSQKDTSGETPTEDPS